MSKSPATYDLKGLNCPLPVLKARKRLAGMRTGSRLWLETTDPLAVIDITHMCNEDGHRLLETQKMEDGHRFHIRKGGGPT